MVETDHRDTFSGGGIPGRLLRMVRTERDEYRALLAEALEMFDDISDESTIPGTIKWNTIYNKIDKVVNPKRQDDRGRAGRGAR